MRATWVRVSAASDTWFLGTQEPRAWLEGQGRSWVRRLVLRAPMDCGPADCGPADGPTGRCSLAARGSRHRSGDLLGFQVAAETLPAAGRPAL